MEGLMEQKRLHCSVVRDHLNNKFNLRCSSIVSLHSSPSFFGFYFTAFFYGGTAAESSSLNENNPEGSVFNVASLAPVDRESWMPPTSPPQTSHTFPTLPICPACSTTIIYSSLHFCFVRIHRLPPPHYLFGKLCMVFPSHSSSPIQSRHSNALFPCLPPFTAASRHSLQLADYSSSTSFCLPGWLTEREIG